MRVIAHTKFDFMKIPAGKVIVENDSPCDSMYLLTNGTVKAETASSDNGYSVTEETSALLIIQPENIFGLHQRFRSTFTASADTNLIAISKAEVTRLYENFTVFRLNVTNMLATKVQRQQSRAWNRPPADLRERIVRFFASHCQYDNGHKVFKIKMERLGMEVNDSRLDVSRALNSMQRDNLLSLGRGRIVIPSLKRLYEVTER